MHVFPVYAFLCVREGWGGLVVIPVFFSPTEHTMHEYTHSHFTFRTVYYYSDGGQGTHIDYTDFLKKKKEKGGGGVKKRVAPLCR